MSHKTLLTACSLSCLLMSSAAWSQTVAPSSDADSPKSAPSQQATDANNGDAGTTASGDIIVTALRRSSTLQDAPLSIAAITDDGLRKLGANNLTDYFRQIPNLNLTQGQLGQSRISIRGINAAGEATVGLYYGETPVTGPSTTTQDSGGGQADLNLFDVERVEVLRGPQGTLYGSSSMAGTLRVIFNKPNTEKAEMAAEGQVSSVDGGSVGYFAKAMVNEPIIKDVLAVRIAAFHEQRPGYIDDVVVGGKNVNSSTSNGIRGLIGFTPTPNVDITGTVIYQQSNADNQQGWYQSVGKYKTNSPLQLPFNNKLQLYSVTANWKLPGVTLTATGSIYRYDILRTTDFTPSYISLATNAAACRRFLAISAACSPAQMTSYASTVRGMLPISGWQPAWLKTQSAEVRAASNGTGPFQWTVGGFYEHRRDYVDSNTSLADPATGQTYMPLQNRAYRFVSTNLTQKAAFVDLSFTPIKGLTIEGGARYFDYSKVTSGQSLKGDILFNSFPTPYTQAGASAKGWLEKGTISYHVTPHLLTYITASKGFRPGGANNVPTLPSGLVAYRPDSLWNYEMGVKSSWLDNALVVNVAVFQSDWTDMQTAARTADGLFSYIANAGKARVRGAEAEITARPVHGLLLSGGLGYTDAKLSEDQANSNIQLTGTTGLKGDLLPNVPRFTGSATASYSFPLSNSANGLLRADYAYTGAMQSSFRPTTDPYFERYGNYSSINLKLGVENERRGIYLFVQNLTNELGVTGASSGPGYKRLIFTIPPRTIGINGRVSF